MAPKGSVAQTGARCTIVKTSQMVDTDMLPHVFEVDEDNMVSDIHDPALTDREFLPAGRFPESEQKWALTAVNAAPVADPNMLRLFYVKVSLESNAGHPDVRVIEEVRNGNTCKWEFTNLGQPSSTLPDAAAIERITQRINQKGIKKGSGTWIDREWDAVLASLDKLTAEELTRIAGVEIHRAETPQEAQKRRAGKCSDPNLHLLDPNTGGCYSQLCHQIFLYDIGLQHYNMLALGVNPKTMLPASAHTVFHEVAHAIAYAPVREAISKMKEKGDAMEKKWGNAAFSFKISSGSDGKEKWSYNPDENMVEQDDRKQFNDELNEFLKLYNEAGKASDLAASGTTAVTEMFGQLVSKKKIPPVTPYSKKKGGEEFFCDSFSLWKWNPDWLKQNRKEVYEFFSGNKHLA